MATLWLHCRTSAAGNSPVRVSAGTTSAAGMPSFLVLNMADVAKDQGKSIDAKAIEEKLGIPVIPFSATDIKSYDVFYEALSKAISQKREEC